MVFWSISFQCVRGADNEGGAVAPSRVEKAWRSGKCCVAGLTREHA